MIHSVHYKTQIFRKLCDLETSGESPVGTADMEKNMVNLGGGSLRTDSDIKTEQTFFGAVKCGHKSERLIKSPYILSPEWLWRNEM